MQSKTFDADGDVVSTLVGTNTITISFSKKQGRENYGNEDIFVSMQIDADPESDDVALEAKVRGGFAFLKTLVYEQLGLDTTVSDTGVVADVPGEEKPKAKSSYSGGKGKSKAAASGGDTDKAALWSDLADAIENVGDDGRIKGFYDNRPKIESGEYSEKSPQFKHIKSGTGLWLNDKDIPEGVVDRIEAA
jgi:hypothetical protein